MMQPTQMTYPGHVRAALLLGLPLIGSHVAQFAISLTDTIMLGWYDVEVLAAQVLAATLFFVLFILGSGFAIAVMPLVASAEGSGDEIQVRRVTRMGLWASLFYTVLVTPIMLFSEPLLIFLGQEEHLAELGAQYLQIVAWGMFPSLLVMVLKSYLAALERAQVVLWVTLAAVAVNIVLNYALIFGNWGFPELGIRGSAIASFLVQVVSGVALALFVVRAVPEHALFQRIWRPDWEAFREVFQLGWPIGLTNLFEVSLFAASSVMIGWLGAIPLAAHGIALNVVSLVFMIHLGLSNVATVRAGRAQGRRDPEGLKRGARVVIALSILVGLVSVLLLLTIPEQLLGIFIGPDDPQRAEVIAIGVGLLAAGALFQMVDATQVMALGLLRGVQDTRVPMILAAMTYWGVGIPTSYVLGFSFGFGGVGVWLGLATGLGLAAVVLMLRFWGWSVRNITAG